MSDARVESIKRVVSIPKYFYEIIIPEMKGYYSDYTVDFEIRPVAKCPLHGEDTPSFRWYEETNTFFCFGCRAGGDVIHLHRKFMGYMNGKEPSFNDSVNYLYDRFISRLDVKYEGKKEEVVQEKSSTVEKLLFCNYISKLENILMTECRYQVKEKMKIYNIIDEVVLLVSLDVVNALDAKKYVETQLENIISD